jgi:hypothetical protein
MKKVLLILLGLMMATSLSYAQATYVGSETCLGCHNGNTPGASDKTSWRSTLHANGFSNVLTDANSLVPMKGMACDANQNGVDDFKDGLDLATTPNFAQFGANAPKLNYSAADGYTITIGTEVMRVYLSYGGTGYFKQRYVVKLKTTGGESENYYIAPCQYNDKTHEWVQYHAGNWYDSNNQPIYDANTLTMADLGSVGIHNLNGGCVGCHATGLEVSQSANGEWIGNTKFQYEATDTRANTNPSYFDLNGDGKLDEVNTGCEVCHGPGSNHYGNPAGIINPSRDMTATQINNLCGMCHSRGKSMPNHKFGYSFDDQNMVGWTVQDIIDGKVVADYHSEGQGLWGDGFTSSDHHQQFEELFKSPKPTNEISCITCHDAHGSSHEHQIVDEREEVDGNGNPIVIATDADDNTLCLSCHAGEDGPFSSLTKAEIADPTGANLDAIASAVTAHTHHPYEPTGDGASRCISCHMPKVTKSGVAYDVHSHTFEAIPPQKTAVFNMPNSCAVSCHDQHNPNGDYPNFGIPLTAADHTDWAGANQQALADTLEHYYGPNGIWWQHVVSVENEDLGVPETYTLSQNYPNPFNPTTMIEFSVPTKQDVSLIVYDILGKQVKVLISDEVPAGSYKVTWRAENIASGVYIYRMQAGSFVQTKKMILQK